MAWQKKLDRQRYPEPEVWEDDLYQDQYDTDAILGYTEKEFVYKLKSNLARYQTPFHNISINHIISSRPAYCVSNNHPSHKEPITDDDYINYITAQAKACYYNHMHEAYQMSLRQKARKHAVTIKRLKVKLLIFEFIQYTNNYKPYARLSEAIYQKAPNTGLKLYTYDKSSDVLKSYKTLLWAKSVFYRLYYMLLEQERVLSWFKNDQDISVFNVLFYPEILSDEMNNTAKKYMRALDIMLADADGNQCKRIFKNKDYSELINQFIRIISHFDYDNILKMSYGISIKKFLSVYGYAAVTDDYSRLVKDYGIDKDDIANLIKYFSRGGNPVNKNSKHLFNIETISEILNHFNVIPLSWRDINAICYRYFDLNRILESRESIIQYTRIYQILYDQVLTYPGLNYKLNSLYEVLLAHAADPEYEIGFDIEKDYNYTLIRYNHTWSATIFRGCMIRASGKESYDNFNMNIDEIIK